MYLIAYFECLPKSSFLLILQAFVLTAVSAYVLYQTENYLGISIGWFVVGTCMTGMFVIGHECGKDLLMFSLITVYLNVS